MAITNEQRAIIQALFSGISVQDRTVLAAASTQDLSAGVADIVTSQRGQSMSTAMTALVSGSVSSWPTLEAAATVADGATIYDALAGFTAALQAHDAPAMLAHAVSVSLAAKKHLGV